MGATFANNSLLQAVNTLFALNIPGRLAGNYYDLVFSKDPRGEYGRQQAHYGPITCCCPPLGRHLRSFALTAS